MLNLPLIVRQAYVVSEHRKCEVLQRKRRSALSQTTTGVWRTRTSGTCQTSNELACFLGLIMIIEHTLFYLENE
jgi:hypothetical protein